MLAQLVDEVAELYSATLRRMHVDAAFVRNIHHMAQPQTSSDAPRLLWPPHSPTRMLVARRRDLEPAHSPAHSSSASVSSWTPSMRTLEVEAVAGVQLALQPRHAHALSFAVRQQRVEATLRFGLAGLRRALLQVREGMAGLAQLRLLGEPEAEPQGRRRRVARQTVSLAEFASQRREALEAAIAHVAGAASYDLSGLLQDAYAQVCNDFEHDVQHQLELALRRLERQWQWRWVHACTSDHMPKALTLLLQLLPSAAMLTSNTLRDLLHGAPIATVLGPTSGGRSLRRTSARVRWADGSDDEGSDEDSGGSGSQLDETDLDDMLSAGGGEAAPADSASVRAVLHPVDEGEEDEDEEDEDEEAEEWMSEEEDANDAEADTATAAVATAAQGAAQPRGILVRRQFSTATSLSAHSTDSGASALLAAEPSRTAQRPTRRLRRSLGLTALTEGSSGTTARPLVHPFPRASDFAISTDEIKPAFRFLLSLTNRIRWYALRHAASWALQQRLLLGLPVDAVSEPAAALRPLLATEAGEDPFALSWSAQDMADWLSDADLVDVALQQWTAARQRVAALADQAQAPFASPLPRGTRASEPHALAPRRRPSLSVIAALLADVDAADVLDAIEDSDEHSPVRAAADGATDTHGAEGDAAESASALELAGTERTPADRAIRDRKMRMATLGIIAKQAARRNIAGELNTLAAPPGALGAALPQALRELGGQAVWVLYDQLVEARRPFSAVLHSMPVPTFHIELVLPIVGSHSGRCSSAGSSGEEDSPRHDDAPSHTTTSAADTPPPSPRAAAAAAADDDVPPPHRIAFHPALPSFEEAVEGLVADMVRGLRGLPPLTVTAVEPVPFLAPHQGPLSAADEELHRALLHVRSALRGSALLLHALQAVLRRYEFVLALDPLEHLATFRQHLRVREGSAAYNAAHLKEFRFFRSCAAALQTAIPDRLPLGLFLVDCRHVRTRLQRALTSAADCMLQQFAGEVVALCRRVSGEFGEFVCMMEQEPDDMAALRQLEMGVQLAEDRVRQLDAAMTSVRDRMAVLEGCKWDLADAEMAEVYAAYALPRRLYLAHRHAAAVLPQLFLRFQRRVRRKREQFNKELARCSGEVEGLMLMGPDWVDGAAEAAGRVQEVVRRVTALRGEAEAVNAEERVLGWQPTPFERDIRTLLARCSLCLALWEGVLEWQRLQRSLMTSPLLKLHYPDAASAVQLNLARFRRLVARFLQPGSLAGPFDVAKMMRLSVQHFADHLPVLAALLEPGMRARHWAVVWRVLGDSPLSSDPTAAKPVAATAAGMGASGGVAAASGVGVGSGVAAARARILGVKTRGSAEEAAAELETETDLSRTRDVVPLFTVGAPGAEHQLTLRWAVQRQAARVADLIQEIAERAANELHIERALDAMKEEWQGAARVLRVRALPRCSVPVFLDVAAHERRAEEHAVRTRVLQASPHAAVFLEDLAQWEARLARATAMLGLLASVQQRVRVVCRALTVPDMTRPGISLQGAFRRAVALWRQVVEAGSELSVLEFDKEWVRDTMVACGAAFDALRPGLSSFLHHRRAAFPRLYMLPDEELLHLLALAAAPTDEGASPPLESLVQRCFPGVLSLQCAPDAEPALVAESVATADVSAAAPAAPAAGIAAAAGTPAAAASRRGRTAARGLRRTASSRAVAAKPAAVRRALQRTGSMLASRADAQRSARVQRGAGPRARQRKPQAAPAVSAPAVEPPPDTAAAVASSRGSDVSLSVHALVTATGERLSLVRPLRLMVCDGSEPAAGVVQWLCLFEAEVRAAVARATALLLDATTAELQGLVQQDGPLQPARAQWPWAPAFPSAVRVLLALLDTACAQNVRPLAVEPTTDERAAAEDAGNVSDAHSEPSSDSSLTSTASSEQLSVAAPILAQATTLAVVAAAAPSAQRSTADEGHPTAADAAADEGRGQVADAALSMQAMSVVLGTWRSGMLNEVVTAGSNARMRAHAAWCAVVEAVDSAAGWARDRSARAGPAVRCMEALLGTLVADRDMWADATQCQGDPARATLALSSCITYHWLSGVRMARQAGAVSPSESRAPVSESASASSEHAADAVQPVLPLMLNAESAASPAVWASPLPQPEPPALPAQLMCSVGGASWLYGFEPAPPTARLVHTATLRRSMAQIAGALRADHVPLLVDMTAGRPQAVAQVAELAAALGLLHVEAPVHAAAPGYAAAVLHRSIAAALACGAWLSVTDLHLLPPAVTSALACSLRTVSAALLAARSDAEHPVCIDGAHVHPRPGAAVLLCTRDLCSLPLRSIGALRVLYVQQPPALVQAQVMLLAAGFQHAPALASAIVQVVGAAAKVGAEIGRSDVDLTTVRDIVHATARHRATRAMSNRTGALQEDAAAIETAAVVAAACAVLGEAGRREQRALIQHVIASCLRTAGLPFHAASDTSLAAHESEEFLAGVLRDGAAALGLEPTAAFIHTCLALLHAVCSGRAVALLGPALSGKTRAYQVVAHALSQRSRAALHGLGPALLGPVRTYALSCEAVGEQELLAAGDVVTGRAGILERVWSDVVTAHAADHTRVVPAPEHQGGPALAGAPTPAPDPMQDKSDSDADERPMRSPPAAPQPAQPVPQADLAHASTESADAGPADVAPPRQTWLVLDGGCAPHVLDALLYATGSSTQRPPTALQLLPNGSAVPRCAAVTLIVEAERLADATPRALTDLAVASAPSTAVSWQTLLAAWLRRLPASLAVESTQRAVSAFLSDTLPLAAQCVASAWAAEVGCVQGSVEPVAVDSGATAPPPMLAWLTLQTLRLLGAIVDNHPCFFTASELRRRGLLSAGASGCEARGGGAVDWFAGNAPAAEPRAHALAARMRRTVLPAYGADFGGSSASTSDPSLPLTPFSVLHPRGMLFTADDEMRGAHEEQALRSGAAAEPEAPAAATRADSGEPGPAALHAPWTAAEVQLRLPGLLVFALAWSAGACANAGARVRLDAALRRVTAASDADGAHAHVAEPKTTSRTVRLLRAGLPPAGEAGTLFEWQFLTQPAQWVRWAQSPALALHVDAALRPTTSAATTPLYVPLRGAAHDFSPLYFAARATRAAREAAMALHATGARRAAAMRASWLPDSVPLDSSDSAAADASASRARAAWLRRQAVAGGARSADASVEGGLAAHRLHAAADRWLLRSGRGATRHQHPSMDAVLALKCELAQAGRAEAEPWAALQDVVVPTAQFTAHSVLLETLLRAGVSVHLSGPPDSGKSLLARCSVAHMQRVALQACAPSAGCYTGARADLAWGFVAQEPSSRGQSPRQQRRRSRHGSDASLVLPPAAGSESQDANGDADGDSAPVPPRMVALGADTFGMPSTQAAYASHLRASPVLTTADMATSVSTLLRPGPRGVLQAPDGFHGVLIVEDVHLAEGCVAATRALALYMRACTLMSVHFTLQADGLAVDRRCARVAALPAGGTRHARAQRAVSTACVHVSAAAAGTCTHECMRA